MDFSIVIPALNESRKIALDIQAAAEFLTGNRLQGQIVVVDDGSQDDTARAAGAVRVPASVELRVSRYEPHRGKGYAVRTGMLQTTGNYAMFADCGLCVPYGNVLQGLQMLRENRCDIAHGSRRLIESDILRDQPWSRRLSSTFFRWIIRRFLGIPRNLTDTQCGFKVYKGDIARELYSRCISDGFMFDVEIILRAQRRGYRIEEFPVEWTCDPDSRLSLIRTPWPSLSELRAIKRALTKE